VTPAKKRRDPSQSSVAAVSPQLRHPGSEVGPRARRTIATILDATRQIFLVKGYAGTTIDEITRVANISRGSFYTYFPSKRDVMLALGADSLHAAEEQISSFNALPDDWDLEDLEKWVAGYFDMLDDHGSFVFAWTQAAHEDDEILLAGKKGHLRLCRQMGLALSKLRGKPAEQPTELGLATFAMLERAWAYGQLYGEDVAEGLERSIARIIAATAESL
jgi:AcrR family transcriptional regulator